MAITATVLTTGHQSGGTTITTASVTLSTTKSYTMVVGSETSVSTKNHPTISGWVEKGNNAEVVFNNTMVTLLSLPAGTGATGALTISFGGQTQTFTNWQLIEWSGTDLTVPVVQFNSSHGSGGTASTTLSAFSDSTNNAALAVLSWYSGSGSKPTTYTQISTATGDIPLDSSYKIGQDLTPTSGVATSGAWVVVAQEIRARAAGPIKISASRMDLAGIPIRAASTELFNTPSAGSDSGITFTIASAQTQAIGDVVQINSSGQATLAKADVIANASGFFIAATAVTGSASNTYMAKGVVKFSSSQGWTVGGLVYLSTTGTTTNTLTQTAPSSTDNVTQILGVALANDTLFFNPNLVQIEHI